VKNVKLSQEQLLIRLLHTRWFKLESLT